MTDTGSRSTIFALSSGHGRAGIAVIRMSGPNAGAVIDCMAAPRPKPRYAAVRKLRDPQSIDTGPGDLIDEALVLFFAAPRTETGEDMAEFHVHGGRAVIHATLSALARLPGCRLAEPGEFARRSFENGKIDLTAAEGLADLVDAETDAQRRQALRQAGGALARIYEGWRRDLVATLALVEASLDFSDEVDVSTQALQAAGKSARRLLEAIEHHLADGRRGEILRDGFQVVLAGPPNAGKSSLLNALARREAAIVSPQAGTTRDVIEVRLDLGGLPVIIADTAGLHDAPGSIEQEGIRRTRLRASAADMVVWLVDGAPTAAGAGDLTPPDGLVSAGADLLLVTTKADLNADLRSELAAALPAPGVAVGSLSVSAVTGAGIDGLADAIATRAADRLGSVEDPALTQTRHRVQLDACRDALRRFIVGPDDQPELRAEDLRHAATALGRVTGTVDIEDILDQVFGRFCIGK